MTMKSMKSTSRGPLLAPATLLLWLALAGCAASEEDLCAEAGQHLQSCLGVPVRPRPGCDVDLAQQVLATDCAGLEDGVRGASGLFDDLLGLFDVDIEWAGWFDGGGATTHVLTVYGGQNDHSAYGGTPACGGRPVDGQWYYATGKSTYGCGAKLELRRGDRCVVVEVVDEGPAYEVDRLARESCGSTVIDASPLVSMHLFNVGGAGWSNCRKIEVREVSRSTPPGPCGSWNPFDWFS